MTNRSRKGFLFFLIVLCGFLSSGSVTVVDAAVTAIEQNQGGEALERKLPPTLKQGIPGMEEADVVFEKEVEAGLVEETLDTYLATEELNVTSISSSELNPPQHWSLEVLDGKILVNLHDDYAVDGIRTMVSVHNSSGDLSLTRVWGNMKDHESALTLDMSAISDGTYRIMLWEGVTLDDTVWSLAYYMVEVTSGTIIFTDPAFGNQEIAFMAGLNANYDPDDYNQVPFKYYPYSGSYYSAYNVEDIIATAKRITADAVTDEQKVRAIHDWVCLNFAYDYESFYDGDIINAADAAWTFDNRRGVCSGFARMCQVMFTAVGVPCINVVGYSEGETVGLSPEDADKESNHEWNVVYVNGSWRNMDVTWDCQNRYLGKYDGVIASNGVSYGETTLENNPNYIFYAIPAFGMGGTHLSKEVYMDSTKDSYVTDFTFYRNPRMLNFKLGDKFSCDAVMKYTFSNGKAYSLSIKGKEKTYCSGYNMNIEGRQTVTISFCGKTASYEIVVGRDVHIHTSGDWEIITEAACVTAGLMQMCCTECGEVLQEESIPATGKHTYGEAVVTIEPDCITVGNARYTCEVCGYEENVELEQTEHTVGEWIVAIAPTQMAVGLQYKECMVCHEILDVETIPMVALGIGETEENEESEEPLILPNEELLNEPDEETESDRDKQSETSNPKEDTSENSTTQSDDEQKKDIDLTGEGQADDLPSTDGAQEKDKQTGNGEDGRALSDGESEKDVDSKNEKETDTKATSGSEQSQTDSKSGNGTDTQTISDSEQSQTDSKDENKTDTKTVSDSEQSQTDSKGENKTDTQTVSDNESKENGQQIEKEENNAPPISGEIIQQGEERGNTTSSGSETGKETDSQVENEEFDEQVISTDTEDSKVSEEIKTDVDRSSIVSGDGTAMENKFGSDMVYAAGTDNGNMSVSGLQDPEEKMGAANFDSGTTGANIVQSVAAEKEKNAGTTNQLSTDTNTDVVGPSTYSEVQMSEEKVGKVHAVGDYVYEITSVSEESRTVTITGFVDSINRKKITSVTIPKQVIIESETYTVTGIGKEAFSKCTALSKVMVANTVTVIGEKAFSGCTKLTKITIPNSVILIEKEAFSGCSKLTKVTIPAKVTTIGVKAFYGCKKLKNIVIKSDKLTAKNVGSKAFKGIAKKAVIKVPKNKLNNYKKLLKKKGISSKVQIKKG